MKETEREHRRALSLLARCREGDELAHEALTRLVARRFAWMIRDLVSADPVLAHEDLEQEFRKGIWLAIAKVKDVKDPIYHLALRGRYEVLEMLEVWYRRHYGVQACRVWNAKPQHHERLPEDWDLPNTHLDYDPEYVLELKTEREDACRRLALLATVSLTGRQSEAWDWMRAHADELSWNGRSPEGGFPRMAMANGLGVSEQAASVLRRKVFEKMAAM